MFVRIFLEGIRIWVSRLGKEILAQHESRHHSIQIESLNRKQGEEMANPYLSSWPGCPFIPTLWNECSSFSAFWILRLHQLSLFLRSSEPKLFHWIYWFSRNLNSLHNLLMANCGTPHLHNSWANSYFKSSLTSVYACIYVYVSLFIYPSISHCIWIFLRTLFNIDFDKERSSRAKKNKYEFSELFS